MRKPIAKIRISAGNPGWYDSLTNIHLTIARPTAFVYEGQNVTNVKKAIKFKIVQLIEGELEPATVIPTVEEPVVENKVEDVREVIDTPVEEDKKVEEPVAEEVKEEVPAEEVKEETVEEEKPKKKVTRKRTKKSEVTE